MKVISFRVKYDDFVYLEPIKKEENSGEKLANNIIRTKSTILQYALCNPWEHFVTMTLDPKKYDRHDLETYRKDLAQHIRNLRKKYNSKIEYLLVPERHKDGAWHMHGFFSGIPEQYLTEFQPDRYSVALRKLKAFGYKNWLDYAEKFGFVSVDRIKDQVKAAMYITKYVTKDLGDAVGGYGKHMYFSTHGLSKAETVAIYYSEQSVFERYAIYETPFCSLGWLDDTLPELPDRDGFLMEPRGFEVVTAEDEARYGTTEEVAAVFRAAEVEKIRRQAYAEISAKTGLDLFENITYKQLELIIERGAYLN